MEGHLPWQNKLNQIIRDTIPLKKRPFRNKTTPIIVNMVSTVCILPQNHDGTGITYRLPLEALSIMFGPGSQYAPVQFAANILKLTTSVADSTVLIFGSGKFVQVSAETEYHTLKNNQYFRLLLEQVPCLMRDSNTGDVYFGSLKGKTIFDRNIIHNIVGHGDLHVKLDLKALRDANPDAVWIPDSFNAAKCNVWLTEDCECHCGNVNTNTDDFNDPDLAQVMKKVCKKKCSCQIKALLFKSGKAVFIGGTEVSKINAVYYRLLNFVTPYVLGNGGGDDNEKKPLYEKMGTMMVKGTVSKRKKQKEMGQSEAIALVLTGARDFKTKKQKSTLSKSTAPPFIKLCDAGRLSEVKTTLLFDADQLNVKDENGNTAVQRLMSIERTPEQELVLQYLLTLDNT